MEVVVFYGQRWTSSMMVSRRGQFGCLAAQLPPGYQLLLSSLWLFPASQNKTTPPKKKNLCMILAQTAKEEIQRLQRFITTWRGSDCMRDRKTKEIDIESSFHHFRRKQMHLPRVLYLQQQQWQFPRA